jgi:hypothetical protein
VCIDVYHDFCEIRGAALVVHLPGWAMDTLVRNDNPLAREKGQA